jgi:hypothetical protein
VCPDNGSSCALQGFHLMKPGPRRDETPAIAGVSLSAFGGTRTPVLLIRSQFGTVVSCDRPGLARLSPA